MSLFVMTLVVVYTVVLGTVGIVLCLLVPGGAALMPLARLWSWLVLRTARVGWRATYDPRLDPGRPAVYVSNHQSQFDIPALVLTMPANFRMVAKRVLVFIPFFGWALWLAGFIFIDRGNRDRAIKSLERAAHRLRKGTSVVIFAEGTRSADGTLLPFKRGGFVLAIQAAVPVVPVTVQGGREVLPKGSLRIRPGTIDVHFGEPIDSGRFTYETRDDLIGVARAAIGARLRDASTASPSPSPRSVRA